MKPTKTHLSLASFLLLGLLQTSVVFAAGAAAGGSAGATAPGASSPGGKVVTTPPAGAPTTTDPATVTPTPPASNLDNLTKGNSQYPNSNTENDAMRDRNNSSSTQQNCAASVDANSNPINVGCN